MATSPIQTFAFELQNTFGFHVKTVLDPGQGEHGATSLNVYLSEELFLVVQWRPGHFGVFRPHHPPILLEGSRAYNEAFVLARQLLRDAIPGLCSA